MLHCGTQFHQIHLQNMPTPKSRWTWQKKKEQGGTLKKHIGAKGGIHQKEHSMCKTLGTIPTSEMKQPNQAGWNKLKYSSWVNLGYWMTITLTETWERKRSKQSKQGAVGIDRLRKVKILIVPVCLCMCACMCICVCVCFLHIRAGACGVKRLMGYSWELSSYHPAPYFLRQGFSLIPELTGLETLISL